MSMQEQALTLRPMTDADLESCLSFTQQVNWPHRLLDWQLHYALGNGYVFADNQQQLAGCILWWNYGASYGTIGLVVVPAHMQGQGLGRKLMQAVLAQAGERSLQLVATLAGKKLYQQCGFREVDTIAQVQGIPVAYPVRPVASQTQFSTLTNTNLNLAQQLDAQAYSADRAHLLAALLTQGSGVIAFAAGKAVGYGMLRTSGRGQTIGPIIAAEPEIARQIAIELLQQTDGFVRFDLTEQASSLKAMLLEAGLQQVDLVSVMVKGDYLPGMDTAQSVFALASQALG